MRILGMLYETEPLEKNIYPPPKQNKTQNNESNMNWKPTWPDDVIDVFQKIIWVGVEPLGGSPITSPTHF